MLLLLALGAVSASAGGSTLSPVTRVVTLLKGLQEKVEKDQKAEEDLFTKYGCWAKSVIGAKTMSNEKAQSRKDSLEQYVADLDAGRIELTSERVDLEKEISGLSEDVQTAEAMRTKEHEDYLAAKDELTKAVSALTDAIAVLSAATSGSNLLLLDSKLNGESMESRAAQGEALSRAIEVGNRFLSRGDSAFLERLLSGDVPVPDWKKLNRKADFKMKYKARSTEIQKKLAELQFQFSAGLADVEKKETKAVDIHTKLMTSKKDQLTKAQDALTKMEVEGGARGLSKTQAQDEISALGTQITDDKQYITDVEASLQTKTTEYKQRQKTRADELAAISQAISILHSDDARDLFKKSLSSQGYSFLQALAEQRESSSRAAAQRRSATDALREAARKSGDSRLVALAARVATEAAPSHFAAVIKAIDDMLTQLKGEESSDLATKENCEQTRAQDTRTAATTSRTMDDLSDKITRLEQEIAETEAQIQEKKEEVTDIQASLADAKKVRDAENAEWTKSDKDDEEAAALVHQAMQVLETFYSAQFLQQAPVVEAGKAPPPPPSTWGETYKGKQEESKGIVTILTLIKDDINDDRAKAKTAEDDAAKAYTKLETDSNTQIGNLNSDISTLEGTKSGKETEKGNTETERLTKKGELEAVLQKLQAAAPGCDFFTVNFVTRSSNRQIEMDGLEKAKAILSGASFPAFAQIRKHA